MSFWPTVGGAGALIILVAAVYGGVMQGRKSTAESAIKTLESEAASLRRLVEDEKKEREREQKRCDENLAEQRNRIEQLTDRIDNLVTERTDVLAEGLASRLAPKLRDIFDRQQQP